jgi:hypothetical protein
MKDVLKVSVCILLFGLVALGLYWNENLSPWGKDVQAAKIEHMKKVLCN